MTTDDSLRQSVIETSQTLSKTGLSPGKSGNVSARADADGAMLITPTGVPYDMLTADCIVRVEADGSVGEGQLLPSSEWHFHNAIYKARPDVGGIVHAHSQAATALACTGRDIPAFHYMVAAAGGSDIRCAPYATYGTAELAENAVAALKGRKACLLANHGQIAVGETVEKALALAREVETLAAQYSHALALGDVRILDEAEMDRVQSKFTSYGQQRTDTV